MNLQVYNRIKNSMASIMHIFPEKDLQQEISAHCQEKSFDTGDVIVREGQFVKFVPIVLSGRLRVFQTREDREILLYYVEPAQTCMMSLSASFFNHKSPSRAIAVEKTEALLIPSPLIVKWQKAYDSWNTFVIQTFRNRYDELLDAFSSIAFDNVNKRLLFYLQSRVEKQGTQKIQISHQDLANELGTTRVVISRILKQLEDEQIVRLGRGFIILN